MNEHIGRQSAVGLSIEGTRGTAATTVSKWFKKTSATVLPNVENVIDDSSFGRLEDAEEMRTVREWYAGDMSGVLHADAVGYMLQQMYGESISNETAFESGVFEHDFTLEQSITHPTLTLFVDDPVKSEKYNGGVVGSFSIEATTDDYVRFTANVLAKESASHSEVVSYGTEFDFIGKDITVKMSDTEAGLTGSTALPLKSININWETGAISDWVFGSTSPEHYNGAFDLSFDFTKNYTDQSFETLYKNNNAKYVLITIKGDNVLSATDAPEIRLLLNKAKVTEWTVADAANDLREESVTCKALYNTADASQSSAYIKNLTANY